MSKLFVPVVDIETPRSERDDHSGEFAKHRQFDALSAPRHGVRGRNTNVKKKKYNDRGWGPAGAIGWGVLGKFGGEEQDTGDHIDKTKRKSKLVKNDKGLWVSLKQFKREEALKAKKKKKKKQLPDGPAALWDTAAPVEEEAAKEEEEEEAQQQPKPSG